MRSRKKAKGKGIECFIGCFFMLMKKRAYVLFVLLGLLTMSTFGSQRKSDKGTLSEKEKMTDTMMVLDEVSVFPSIKEKKELTSLPVAANSFNLSQIEGTNAETPKELTKFVPNFHIPDYGSQMTSSIYVRGSGARIDQPVVGMLVDNIPLLNKNSYDFDMFDVERVEFLRGPQGTLYGRNTLCGLINLYTLSPFSYQGTRAMLGFSSGKTFQVKGSHYRKMNERFAFSVAVNARHSKGFFTNIYDDEKCDPLSTITARSRQMWRLPNGVSIENSISVNLLKQGGYPYRLLNDDGMQPVNYNDECQYNRTQATDGLLVKFDRRRVVFTFATGYQYLNDDMSLDQDFLPLSYFTLNQKQKEHAISEEIVFQPKPKQKIWNWKSGAYGFYKHNDMDAPVLFKRTGIEQIILDNANKGIQSVFPDDKLDFSENELPILSRFELPTWGVALYHQSEWKVRKWNFTLGLRFDYEHSKMTYENHADLHYLFTMMMKEYKQLRSQMNGESEKTYFELLPKFCVQFNINKNNNLYFSITKGYKAGGFNTQIFSDILQNRLKNDLMNDMGMKFDGMGESTYDVGKVTSYDPEYNWTYEIGGHFATSQKDFSADVAVFFMDSRDQQLTVFPQGKNTGRMMTNAGKSRTYGAELSMKWRIIEQLHLNGCYGYTHAKFVNFHDGDRSYDDNFVPYSPLHHFSLEATYVWTINRKLLDKLTVSVDGQGTGEIYWDEENRYKQGLYGMLDASVSLRKRLFTLKLWGKNLSNTRYETFEFTSMGNRFCQMSKPIQLGLSVNFEF